jgi:WD40 repeat protein
VLDRPVALKELFSDSAAMRSRFVREALITARLQHPSIVPVYDAGHLGDRSPFYAMKLVAGRPLDKSIAEASTLAQRLALLPTVLAVADAIAYAHNDRIIHRDLKPTNILVGKYGETIVIDWGLAKDLAADDHEALDAGPYRGAGLDETVAGAIMGTPAYMAPEQAAGEAVDERADVYALGAILYHVISGAIPHEGKTLDEMVSRVIGGDIRPLVERVPEVPRDLAAIVSKAMARDPAKRYPNAQGFADDLRRFSTGQLVASHSYGTGELVRRWLKQHRGAVMVAAAALLVLSVFGTLAIRNIIIARGEATASREEARHRLAASYIDRAGNELVHDQAARSLAYTIAAAQVSGLTPDSRLLAAHALDQLPPVRWWRDPQTRNAMFAPGTHDLLVVVADEIVCWDSDADRVRWRVPLHHHDNPVLVGRDMLAFARDHTVGLIAIANGAPIAELSGSAGAHYLGGVAMDAGARWLATTSSDRVDMFDATTRGLVASIPLTKAMGVRVIAADGQHVVVEADPGLMWILDRSGNQVGTFKASLGQVQIAGDEFVYVLPTGADGIAHVAVGDWTGKVRLDLPIGISSIDALEVDVAAKRIALGTEDGSVQVRSLVTGEASWQASIGGRADSVLFDGDVLRVASSSGAVSFDVRSGLEIERVSIPGALFLAASDDHARVAALVVGEGFAAWAPARGELVPLAPTSARVTDLALAPDGTVITAGGDGEIHELRDSRSVRRLGTGGAINQLARLDDGTLITSGADGTIVVRDHDGRELRRFAAGAVATPSPDGHRIAAATSDGTVAIFDSESGKSERTLGKLGNVWSIRWSPDGRRLAAVTTLGAVSVWDVKGSMVRTIPRGAVGATAIAFSNDSRWLARSGEPSDTLYALDGGSDRKLLGAQSLATSLAFSPDGKTVLVAGLGFLSTWDIATGAQRIRTATDGVVTAAAFFANGAYIIAGGMDRRMHVRSADTGAELLAFTVPAPPRKLVVDRGGGRIAVLAGRGATVWTAPAYGGTLDDLRERARCSLDLEVVDGHLRAHSIDLAACNRAAW